MSDPKSKQQLRYAKKKAMRELEQDGGTVIVCDNGIICLFSMREHFERKIRVVEGKISDHDIKLITSKVKLFPQQSREIWCYIRGYRSFKKVEIRKDGTIEVLYDPVNSKNLEV